MDLRQLLALRLRALRKDQRPARRIRQQQLARASAPSAFPSSPRGGSQASSRIPSLPWRDAYAALFATACSFDGDDTCLIDPAEMSEGEQQAWHDITIVASRWPTSALEGIP